MTTSTQTSSSEDLGKLADRAKQANEAVVKAAAAKNRAELEAQVARARQGAEDKAAALKSSAATQAENTRNWWAGVQGDWKRHVAQIRENVETTKADLDGKRLERRAEDYEADAIDAVAFAEAAVEEAEYAALDATLARMDADEAAATGE
jgi:hypothetical protein